MDNENLRTTCFLYFFSLEWNPLCWRLDMMWLSNLFFFEIRIKSIVIMIIERVCLASYVLFVRFCFFFLIKVTKQLVYSTSLYCLVLTDNTCNPWRIISVNLINSTCILFPSELCKLYFCWWLYVKSMLRSHTTSWEGGSNLKLYHFLQNEGQVLS